MLRFGAAPRQPVENIAPPTQVTRQEEVNALSFLRSVEVLDEAARQLFYKLLDADGENNMFSDDEVERIKRYARMYLAAQVEPDVIKRNYRGREAYETTLLVEGSDLKMAAPPESEQPAQKNVREDLARKEEMQKSFQKAVAATAPIEVCGRKIWLEDQLDDRLINYPPNERLSNDPKRPNNSLRSLTIDQKIALVEDYEHQYGKYTDAFRKKLAELKAEAKRN